MILKICEFYYETELKDSEFKEFINEAMFDLIDNNKEFSIDDFIELLEDSNNFEQTSSDIDVDISYTEDELEELYDELLDGHSSEDNQTTEEFEVYGQYEELDESED